MNLDNVQEVVKPTKAKAAPKKTVDEGYVKALEQLLDETELGHPRVFRGIGWRNCI